MKNQVSEYRYVLVTMTNSYLLMLEKIRNLYPTGRQNCWHDGTKEVLFFDYVDICCWCCQTNFIRNINNRYVLSKPCAVGKKFATLDILSDGRTIAGLEIGWSKDEYECPAFLKRYGRRDDGNQYC
jgi:hypothetical protein